MLNSAALHEQIPPEFEAYARQIIDAAFKVHKAIDPGLLESVYESCLLYELRSGGFMSSGKLSCQYSTMN